MTDIDEVLEPVLPRELTAISAGVHEVGPPPTPILAEPYAIRLADPDADADMMSEWMNRPHLVEAWEYDWPSWAVAAVSAGPLDGTYSRPFVGSRRGHDLGYIELYLAAKGFHRHPIRRRSPRHRTARRGRRPDVRQPGHRPDTSAAHRGRRVRPRIALSSDHVRPRPPQQRCPTVVRVRGCTVLGEHDMANRRMALYALPRSPSDAPDIG